MSATARDVAVRALTRIDAEGAYANLVLDHELGRSGLAERDRAFVTDLVYGVTRLRRRLDHAVDPYLLKPVTDAGVLAALRLGAYQLLVLGTPPHAAVSATVDAVPVRKARGLVNAVLRKVSARPPTEPGDLATRLSYPDWVVERLTTDLGADDAEAALATMNEPAAATERDDGYVQDRASQLVGALAVEHLPPHGRVADLCAAPGGKATAMARPAGLVAAADARPKRAGLVRRNAHRLGLDGIVKSVAADATAPAFRPGTFDAVLVDAPCSGLGTLRRRADARWRIDADAPERLADLQRRILAAAAGLLAPGGVLTYSVCTLTAAEGPDVAAAVDGLVPLEPPGDPWRPWGSGAVLLPQVEGTDGMFVARWRLPA